MLPKKKVHHPYAFWSQFVWLLFIFLSLIFRPALNHFLNWNISYCTQDCHHCPRHTLPPGVLTEPPAPLLAAFLCCCPPPPLPTLHTCLLTLAIVLKPPWLLLSLNYTTIGLCWILTMLLLSLPLWSACCHLYPAHFYTTVHSKLLPWLPNVTSPGELSWASSPNQVLLSVPLFCFSSCIHLFLKLHLLLPICVSH